MESADKGAKAIKLATGWERGADGKWRYEVSDGTIKENPKYETVRDEAGLIGYKTTLGELINDEQLFLSYPELREILINQLKLLPSNYCLNRKINLILLIS